MPLVDSLDRDLVAAMKAKDADKLSALRMLKAAIGHKAIEKKKDKLDDAEAIEVIQRQVKQRRESLESFEKAGRNDLAEKERKELVVLQAYLPEQLGDDEIRKLVQQAMSISGAKSKQEMGKLMKELMPLVKGKADGKKVNEIVNQLLV